MKKKTLVLGASLNSSRYSNMAIKRLVQSDQPVVALGLREGNVAGVNIDTGKPAYKDLHTITLYINPMRQEEYYEYILNLKPERVIFNPGTENPFFAKMLKANGIEPDYACTLVLLGTNSY